MPNSLINKKLKNMPNNQNLKEADQLFFDGDNKLVQNQTEQAKTDFEKAIEKYPEHGRSHNHLGFLYETKYQDFTKAEEHYKKAIEYAPEYQAGYSNYSRLLSITNKFDELEKLLEKALEIPGANKMRIYNEYAIMYENKGEFDKAIEYYKKTITYAFVMQDFYLFKDSIERCKMKKEAK